MPIGVVDMPSLDEPLIDELSDSGRKIFIAEQNNGFIWEALRRSIWKHRARVETERLVAINTLDVEDRPQFIHSATYEQLLDRFGLSAGRLVQRLRNELA